MVERSSLYNRLATREGFNTSVRHINRTLDLLDVFGPRKNLADEINEKLSDKDFDEEAVLSAVTMLLVEKSGYIVLSRNLKAVTTDSLSVVSETASWKAVDLLIGYHHPDLGYIVINPKNPDSAPIIAGFRKYELVVLYAGMQKKNDTSTKLCQAALENLILLLEGKKAKAPAGITSGPYVFVAPAKPKAVKTAKAPKTQKKTGKTSIKAPVTAWSQSSETTLPSAVAVVSHTAAPPPAVQAAPGRSKMSPLVSVVVTNELFHNGNVEAWKRIIRSYNSKYPNLQVFIYYDGERIVDINTLFKWGKVKHGSCIQFCVSGEDIQDLAKLSRYFRQGASHQFEAFLHGSPDTVMNLF